jgi:ATP-dependent RNA helicase DHX8/PRP22
VAVGVMPVLDEDETNLRARKRLTSPEKWELKQLIAAGAIDKREYPDYDDETGLMPQEDAGSDEEVEIELREDEPLFLQGQTTSAMPASPVRIVKNPDGSLQRAAMTQSTLAEERRQLRQAQYEAKLDVSHIDLTTRWTDPMPENGQRQLAMDIKSGIQEDMPEWKKAAQGGNKVAYGKKTTLSIIEQREGLPIFKLKGPLIQAIKEN